MKFKFCVINTSIVNKKGFTLVELLAVIVIIGVIALIATPVIINVIDNVEKNAFEQSVNGLIRAVTNDSDHHGYKFTRYKVVDGVLYDEKNNKIHTSGGDKENGDIYINDNGDISVAVNNKKWCAIKKYDNKKNEILDYVDGECRIESIIVELPTYSIDPAGDVWAKSKVVTIHYPERESIYKYEYSINDGNSWETVTSGTEKKVTFTKNGNVIARIYDGSKYHTASSFAVTKIDNIAPQNVSVSKTRLTSSTITVKGNGIDNESGIANYEFSKDNGTSWINNDGNNTYTFKGLSQKTYQMKVRITDKVGNSTISNAVAMTPELIVLPTYSIDPAGDVWAKRKTVTIHYPENTNGYTYQYSIDGGSSWKNVEGTSKSIEFTSNGNIIARIYDGNEYYTASTFAVTKIDNEPPVFTNKTNSSNGNWSKENVTVSTTATDSGSGIDKFEYSYDNSTWYSDWNSTTSDSAIGIWSADRNNTLYVRVSDKVGNKVSYTTSIKIDKTPPKIVKFTNSSGNTWTNKNVDITVEASDGGSGVNRIEYGYDGATWYSDWGNKTQTTASDSWTAERNSNFYVRAVDNAGNYEVNKSVIKIDKTAPKLDNGYQYVQNNWATFGWNVTDNLSGFNSSSFLAEYCYTGQKTASCGATCSTGNKYSHKPSWVFGAAENYYFQGMDTPTPPPGALSSSVGGGVNAECIKGYQVRTNIKLCDIAGNCATVRNKLFYF